MPVAPFGRIPWTPAEDAVLLQDDADGVHWKLVGFTLPNRTLAARHHRLAYLRRQMKGDPNPRHRKGTQIDKDILAHWAEQRERRDARQMRPCMCCRESFPSEGSHNRLCEKCTKRSHDFTPFDDGLRSGGARDGMRGKGRPA